MQHDENDNTESAFDDDALSENDAQFIKALLAAVDESGTRARPGVDPELVRQAIEEIHSLRDDIASGSNALVSLLDYTLSDADMGFGAGNARKVKTATGLVQVLKILHPNARKTPGAILLEVITEDMKKAQTGATTPRKNDTTEEG